MADLQDSDYYFSKDTYLDENAPDTCYGWISTFRLAAIYGKGEDHHEEWPTLYADISALSADRVVREAKLHLYASSVYKEALDTMTEACWPEYVPAPDDDWVESEACWNEKATGVNWEAGGPSRPRSQNQDGPTSTGWYEFIVTTMAAYAHKVHSGIFDIWLHIYFTLTDRIVTFRSNEDTSDPPGSPEYLRPFLRITHEPKGRQVFM